MNCYSYLDEILIWWYYGNFAAKDDSIIYLNLYCYSKVIFTTDWVSMDSEKHSEFLILLCAKSTDIAHNFSFM